MTAVTSHIVLVLLCLSGASFSQKLELQFEMESDMFEVVDFNFWISWWFSGPPLPSWPSTPLKSPSRSSQPLTRRARDARGTPNDVLWATSSITIVYVMNPKAGNRWRVFPHCDKTICWSQQVPTGLCLSCRKRPVWWVLWPSNLHVQMQKSVSAWD
ncbi:hypothetical protein N658DRAFT_298330 [Parathielavia hyrcaniae]|uniref:Uncharacterized protein n=1 Tax=Parathielavia hyrcaniae TaxID=113614 RepID=A0AAN6T338_9PEZI|nr:hypothetical protein N658DRAFT_298330 [Parathielavia hyrcaniae]